MLHSKSEILFFFRSIFKIKRRSFSTFFFWNGAHQHFFLSHPKLTNSFSHRKAKRDKKKGTHGNSKVGSLLLKPQHLKQSGSANN